MTHAESPEHLRGAALLPQADGTVVFLPHVELTWAQGRFTSVQPLRTPADANAPLLLPGFVDLHCHWPQAHVRGQFSGQLLPWLRESIWPAEAAFVAESVAHAQAARFLEDVTHAGTCAGLFFGAPFTTSTAVFLAHMPRGFWEGPAIMSQNAPEALLQPVAETLAALRALNTPQVSIAPRFAPNLDTDDLAACGKAALATGWPVQSHLSENTDEVAWVGSLFPDAKDYTDVYDRAALLGPRSVFAHGVHLTDRELARLAATQTLIAHCPTSNEALASGRMPLERLRQAGVPWVLATDVGAGPSLSQLHVMQRFLAVHEGQTTVTACEALTRTTAIPGAWLAQFDPTLSGLGTFTVGAPAHIVAVPRPQGDNAESVLRALLSPNGETFEQVPQSVILWGERLF